jgi:hypothetical protein
VRPQVLTVAATRKGGFCCREQEQCAAPTIHSEYAIEPICKERLVVLKQKRVAKSFDAVL